ncbi:Lrp/AsnC family transcriptional regulator [Marinobacteraceae bacterium S3BR75-40.1]
MSTVIDKPEPSNAVPELTATQRAILNRLQDGLPLTRHPYAEVARELGIGEAELLGHLETFLATGLLTRFGPLFHAGEMGGGLTLAAMSVAPEDFDRVAGQVNGFPEVAHNYRREHPLNMWFVLATETPEAVQNVIERIQARTGYPVYNMPKEEEFHVHLRFAV